MKSSPSHRLWVSTHDNVGTTTGHVGRDGNRAEASGLRDDFSFAFVVLGVQNFMLHAAFLEQIGEPFALFNRNGTDQNRATAVLHFGDFIASEAVFLIVVFVGDYDRVLSSTLSTVPTQKSKFFRDTMSQRL